MATKMPKRNPPDIQLKSSTGGAEPKTARGRGAGSLLLFWPFYLLNLLTRRLSTPVKILVRLIGHPVVAGAYCTFFLAVFYGFRAQQYDLSKIHAMPERSIIRDRQGEEIGRIHGDKRSIVPLRQVAENFRKAILAREDERFYKHGAFDVISLGRAVLKNLQGKREGASTITQQLASDIFGLKQGENRGYTLRQLDRKFLEIAIAFRLEATLEKDEILEAYINQINWGRQIKGVGEASRIYFEKHPSELTLSESALLAGIVRGPDSFNPFKSMQASARERGTTLDRMVDAAVIRKDEAEAAKKEPIEVRPQWRRSYVESYAMLAIQRDLEIILEKENIELGGLNITTTIDLRLQHVGEEALDKKLRSVERMSGYNHQTRATWKEIPEEKRVDPEYLQGAAVVVENRTGAVLAVVGGRDANESPFNRVTRAIRPIGSLCKPFVYLAAFDKGLRAETRISDGPLQPGEIVGAAGWHPRNSDGKFGGLEPVSYGLIHSRNTMSVRIGNYAGLDNVAEAARVIGFTTPVPKTPMSFLGSWGASPLEVASTFTIFPNEGIRYRPYLISEIKDRDGNILYPPGPLHNPMLPYRAAKASSSWSVSRILQEVATSGTAAAVKRLGFDKPVGGKTGTTDDFQDAWFSGYTSNLTCAVWVGFDKPVTTIEGGYGATLALPVWVDIMKTADRLGYKAGAINAKVDLVSEEICRLSGKRATEGCREAGTVYTDKVPADTLIPDNDFCPIHPAKAKPVMDPELPPPAPAPPLKALPVAQPVPPRAQRVE